MDLCSVSAWIGLRAFLLILSCICFWNMRKLFLEWHGISHRLAGVLHLSLLAVGTWTAAGTAYVDESSDHPTIQPKTFFWIFDLLLGCSGVLLTLTAARDFPHKYVANQSEGDYVQSGTLHQKAIVTQDEMIEHAFYQFLNLWQAMYLHTQYHCKERASNDHYYYNGIDIIWIQLALLWLVTAPWLFRGRVPVHSFSHNWKMYQQQKMGQTSLESSIRRTAATTATATDYALPSQPKRPLLLFSPEVIMYRIKKAQYIFYKHCILHGVNLAVVVVVVIPTSDVTALSSEIPYSFSWRIFWMLLNTSYVMEFFLQSLVKRRLLSHGSMLLLNQGLMTAATLGATVVLKYVPLWMVVVSIGLNFVHRHHDVVNTMGIATVMLGSKYLTG
ncbi:hypothetical protein IV203_003399 [Nitzschia inconspicua]|uniref:Uncharacterized protein n=1 Tax=Nitzschia inconspicua TaxID=303405 RepID=A0A9K3PNN8_9STRA|nr:hypothetical protein IV203_003399 [Nitzschia inconspicua]